MKTKILTTDVTFTIPRGAGAGCLCSRCLAPIINEKPVKPKGRKGLPKGNYELRYHQQCWNKHVFKVLVTEVGDRDLKQD